MNGSRQPDPFLIRCGSRELDCRPGATTLIMGILNVTPDSFADGGRYFRCDDALRRVDEMVAEGIDILDVGGESTRPRGRTYGQGATPVSADDEIARIVPVIEAVASHHPELIISADTYKSKVAQSAIDAGAHMINDVTGLRFDSDMARVAGESDVPIVLMHSVGDPGTMPHDTEYEDVIRAVRQSLESSIAAAENAGVKQMFVDPGFGFGKRVTDNMKLIARLDELAELRRPILVGISRKSSIGSVLSADDQPVPVADRLFGSLGAAAVAIMNGASIIRCHDVSATKDVACVVDSLMSLSMRPTAEAHA